MSLKAELKRRKCCRSHLKRTGKRVGGGGKRRGWWWAPAGIIDDVVKASLGKDEYVVLVRLPVQVRRRLAYFGVKVLDAHTTKVVSSAARMFDIMDSGVIGGDVLCVGGCVWIDCD